MPAMLRHDKKATRIAFKLIGTPMNFTSKKSEKQREIDRRIWFEETSRSR